MQDLKITIVQTDIAWQDERTNLAHFGQILDGIREKTHLIVFPETFTTGFTMDVRRCAVPMEGEAVQWIKSKSMAMGADIAGSIIIVENGCYFNRLVWAKPDGRMYTYDKKHLFRMAGEDRAYTPGDKNITVELEGWRIRPFICYDLRFPLWTRNFDNSYDATVFIANWPAKRSHHWKSLILARAIENQSYVAAVNRTGADGKGNDYCGDSAIIDPLGEIIFQGGRDECVYTSSLSYDLLADCRVNFPVWKDADGDRVK